MADLSLRFDDYTEEFSSKMLAEIREFAEERPLPDQVSVEVGSNRGKFISALAAKQPDRFHLGIEIKRKLARIAQRRVERHGQGDNAAVICADAKLALPVIVDDGKLAEFFLLYPDPWWKKRHDKRKVLQTEFLDILAQKMPKGGKIWIRTDVGPLADEMRDTLISHPEFEPVKPEDYPLDPFPWTTREYHCFEAGLPSHLVYYQRK